MKKKFMSKMVSDSKALFAGFLVLFGCLLFTQNVTAQNPDLAAVYQKKLSQVDFSNLKDVAEAHDLLKIEAIALEGVEGISPNQEVENNVKMEFYYAVANSMEDGLSTKEALLFSMEQLPSINQKFHPDFRADLEKVFTETVTFLSN